MDINTKKIEIIDALRTADSVVVKTIHEYLKRAEVGLKKYGTDLDRTDLTLTDWIKHAQEEGMDMVLYLEKIKQGLKKQEKYQQLTEQK